MAGPKLTLDEALETHQCVDYLLESHPILTKALLGHDVSSPEATAAAVAEDERRFESWARELVGALALDWDEQQIVLANYNITWDTKHRAQFDQILHWILVYEGKRKLRSVVTACNKLHVSPFAFTWHKITDDERYVIPKPDAIERAIAKYLKNTLEEGTQFKVKHASLAKYKKDVYIIHAWINRSPKPGTTVDGAADSLARTPLQQAARCNKVIIDYADRYVAVERSLQAGKSWLPCVVLAMTTKPAPNVTLEGISADPSPLCNFMSMDLGKLIDEDGRVVVPESLSFHADHARLIHVKWRKKATPPRMLEMASPDGLEDRIEAIRDEAEEILSMDFKFVLDNGRVRNLSLAPAGLKFEQTLLGDVWHILETWGLTGNSGNG